MLFVTRGCVVFADVLVLIVTWVKTFKQWKEARQLNMSLSVTRLLLRDGTSSIDLVVQVALSHQLFHNFRHVVFCVSVYINDPLNPIYSRTAEQFLQPTLPRC